VVSTDRLIDALWEEKAPESGRKALQVYVSGLRKALGKERLQTQAPGYILRLTPDEFDRGRFERLVGEGRHAEALALWRGPALQEFAYQRFAGAEIERIEELRLACLEQRIEDDLAAGRHGALVGELEALVREHPLRERARAQLMVSLYRSGRQSEALHAYRDVRLLLAEELGLDPGPELQRLEKAILVQDTSLLLSAPRRLLRTGRADRLAVVVVVALAAGALLALGRDGPGTEATEPLAEVVLAHATSPLSSPTRGR
jgi:DNA-binding SARP family transcriptional activator